MSYIGGKGQNGLLQKIINLFPPHRVYLEAFCGSAAIARAKKPAAETILIDKIRVPQLSALPAGAKFIQGDGVEFLARYKWQGDELAYIDPPYLLGTRGGRRYYAHEMTAAQHRRLLDIALEIPAHVMISGYSSAMYDDALAGWNREECQVMTRGHTWATEVIWFNYARPEILHDYAKLGADHNDRVRIRRKVQRWAARLARQQPLERAALFDALIAAMGVTAARAAIAQHVENGTQATPDISGTNPTRRD